MADIAAAVLAVRAFIDAVANNARKSHDHVQGLRENPSAMDDLSTYLGTVRDKLSNVKQWLDTPESNVLVPLFRCHLMMSVEDVSTRISKLQ